VLKNLNPNYSPRRPGIAIVQTRGAQACTRGKHILTITLLSHATEQSQLAAGKFTTEQAQD